MNLQPEPMRVLVVDDTAQNLEFICHVIRRMGHVPVSASSGEQALEMFQSDSPDMILMDVMMPGIGGLEATRRIRTAASGRWVPIIMVTACGHEDDIVAGLNAGADDYLLKPLSLNIFQAKVRVFEHIVRLQREITQRSEELGAYYQQAEEERRIGAWLMEYMINRPGLREPEVRYNITPAWHFSGDLLAAAQTPGQSRHVMLSDGMGHGLPAAITSLPLFDTFYAMTELGYGIDRIAEAMNKRLHAMSPRGRFASVTLASINPWTGVIEVWNGGNPQPCLIGTDGEILRRWSSKYLPLGILPPDDFCSEPEVHPYGEACQFFLWSDGLIEQENEAGDPYGMERPYGILQASVNEARFDALLREVIAHRGSVAAADDISLMMVEVGSPGGVAPATIPAARVEHRRKILRMSFHFDVYDLKYLDVVPILTGLLEKIEGVRDCAGHVFLILAELVNNALDHGLLCLDSSLKTMPDGFDLYLEARKQRLNDLRHGYIQIDLEEINHQGRDVLKIKVCDSGAGFDRAQVTKSLGEAGHLHGRGIALVQQLGAEMHYSEAGNEVVVYYDFGK